MMLDKDYLIMGLNPYTISAIIATKGFRIGTHPLKNRFYRQKHPILYKIFGYPYSDSTWYNPEVVIYGSDGTSLLRVRCRSNEHVHMLEEKLNNDLGFFVRSTLTT